MGFFFSVAYFFCNLLNLLLMMIINLLIILKLCLETDCMCCLRQFLYPSEEDLYKLIRFLVEKLSDMSEGRRTADVNDVTGRRRIKEDSQKSSSSEWPKKADGAGVDRSCEEVEAKLKDVRLRSKVPEWFITKAEDASASRPYKTNIIPQKMDETAVNVTVCSSNGDFSKNELTSVSSGKDSTEKLVDAGRDKAGSEETAAYEDDEDFLVAKKKGTPSEQSSKVFLVKLM